MEVQSKGSKSEIKREVLEESVGEGHPRERKLSAKVWRLENINGKLAIDDWGREQ